jgi:hypothetical protein
LFQIVQLTSISIEAIALRLGLTTHATSSTTLQSRFRAPNLGYVCWQSQATR